MGWATRQAQCSPWLVSLEREGGGEKGETERERENERRVREERS